MVSLSLLGEPIGSTVLAVLLLSEKPAVAEIAGGVMILLGIYLASKMDQREKKNQVALSEAN